MIEVDGKKYVFDTNACYHGNGRVRLPNGRTFAITCWLESYPPKVGDFYEIKEEFTLATEYNG